MRFIDLDLVRPRIRELVADLERAHEEVMAEQETEKREALIRKYQPRWTALRRAFEAVSYGKCWYVECRNPGADNDIDHFRPKFGVKEAPDHPGYYWLAFNWRNLRLSCQRANRPRRDEEAGEVGGKSDHFPLLDPAMRARGPGDNLNRELPALLDPTNPADPVLLSFKPNGEVDLSPEYGHDDVARARFDASRLYLHLNWPRFRDARVVLYNQIERTVDRGEREAPGDYRNIHAAAGFLDIIRDLIAVMRPEGEYSAAARVYVESFKHVWWIRDIVLRVPA
jgi:uncharacterized protein (TIGR02646 family)